MKKLLSVTLIIFSFPCFAQFAGCIDSLRIRYGYFCYYHYDPVCACDGKTYRNDCFAINEGVTAYAYGICEDIAMDFNPNPSGEYIYIDIVLKREGDLSFMIIDQFGGNYFTQHFTRVTWQKLNLDVIKYPAGVYFMLAYTGESRVYKKLIKIDR